MKSLLKKWGGVLAAVVAAIFPLFESSEYVIGVLVIAGIFTILTLSLNLVTGFTGQFCLGWAAFYGVGAYTSALLTMRLDVSFWLAMPAAGLMSALFGILLGIPTMRLKEIYLAITTLGFGEIVRLIMLNWTDLTRGAMGLPGIPSPSLFGYEFGSKYPYYYLILVLIILTVLIMQRLIDSRVGRALIAIREDELAAKAIGIDTTYYKILAFAVGAFFAGIAGSFYAHYATFIDPHTFAFMESITVLAMVVLGGAGSIYGSVFGAVLLTIIPEVLRDAAEYRLVIFGLMMMLVMLVRPQGVFGKGRDKPLWWRSKKRKGGNSLGTARN